MLRGVLLFALLLQATVPFGVNGLAYRRAITKEEGYRINMVELEQERSSAARIAFATRSSTSSSENFVKRARRHLEDQLQAQLGFSDRVPLQSSTRDDHSAYSSRLLEMSSWEIGKSKLVKSTLLLLSGCVGVAAITYLGILCCQTKGQSPTAEDGQPNRNQPVQSCDNATSEESSVKSKGNENTADAKRGTFANNRGATYVVFDDPPDPSPQSSVPGTGCQSIPQNGISFIQNAKAKREKFGHNRECTYANAEDLAPTMPPPLPELGPEMKRESFAHHRGGTYQDFDDGVDSERESSVPEPRHDDPQLTPGRLHEEPVSTVPTQPYNNPHLTPGRSHEGPVNTDPFHPYVPPIEMVTPVTRSQCLAAPSSRNFVRQPTYDIPAYPSMDNCSPVDTTEFVPPIEMVTPVTKSQCLAAPSSRNFVRQSTYDIPAYPSMDNCSPVNTTEPQEADDDVQNCALQPQSTRLPMTRQGTFTIGQVDEDDPHQRKNAYDMDAMAKAAQSAEGNILEPLIVPTLRKSTYSAQVIQCTDADGINDNGSVSADAVHNGILIQIPRHSDNLDRSPSPRRVHFANEPTVRYKSQDSDETDGRRIGDEQTANKRMAFAQARHSVHYDETFDKLNPTTALTY